MNARRGRRTASSVTVRSPAPLSPTARGAGRRAPADLEQVADDDHVRELGDRRVRVAVDRDDRPGRLHPDLVLDRPADAEREVQLRLDDLAGLADLLAVRDPAGIDRGARRADRAAERLGELLDEREAVGSADPATAGDDDPGVVDRRGRASASRSARRVRTAGRPRAAALASFDDRSRRSASGSAITTFGRTVTIPRAVVNAASVTSLPPNTLRRDGAIRTGPRHRPR